MPENNEFVPFKVVGDPTPDSEIKFDDPNDPVNKKRIAEKVKYFEEHPDEIPDL